MTDHLSDPPTTDSLTFVGTATTVLRLGSFTLLTDPNFLHRGQRAYLGKGMWTRRLTEPALCVDQLPTLDAVLLSHLHGDHFDRVARRSLSRDQPVLTTPAAARRLDRWGFTTVGLRTWGEQQLHRDGETLTVTAVPAVHARGALRALLPSVMGSVVEHRVDDVVRRRVYVSGDTVTGPHLTEIARRHPDLDVAVVHLGGTRVLWHTVTMDAPQGVELLRTVPTQQVVPVHYDDYRVFRDPLSRFVQLARSQGLGDRLTPVGRGETVALAGRD
ncbi:MBL fold metallo-hydrolase [Nocardioides aurantiacus]|uniref:MBL fold metallo-hydrolase n=1 Tax=Nocardioides aurantiacus TaxID=86796 RepID=UPI00403F68F2